MLQLINPTAQSLQVCVVFFDDNENKAAEFNALLSANDLYGLSINLLLGNTSKTFGVVKILGLDNLGEKIERGLVVYKKELIVDGDGEPVALSEARLQPIPTDVLLRDVDPAPGVQNELQLLGCTPG